MFHPCIHCNTRAKMLKEVEIQVHTASTLRGLLDNAEILWDVPNEIMKQLRQLNEQSKGSRKVSYESLA